MKPRVPDQTDSSLRLYLSPAEFIDSDHERVRAKARQAAGSVSDPVEQARVLYRAVRDEIRYDPYIDYTDPETYRASSVLAKGHGYCVGKASLYVALCRATGIPARLGLADVKNHLATPRLLETVGTDVFAYHGYVEIMPGREWVKATPTFNVSLCQRARRAAAGVLRREPTRCCSRSTPRAASSCPTSPSTARSSTCR